MLRKRATDVPGVSVRAALRMDALVRRIGSIVSGKSVLPSSVLRCRCSRALLPCSASKLTGSDSTDPTGWRLPSTTRQNNHHAYSSSPKFRMGFFEFDPS